MAKQYEYTRRGALLEWDSSVDVTITFELDGEHVPARDGDTTEEAQRSDLRSYSWML